MRDELVTVEERMRAAVARDDVGAFALLFLLRRYRSAAREDLGEMLGRALAIALDAYERDGSVAARAAWLAAFVEAAALSDDERVTHAIVRLVELLRSSWGSSSVDEAAAAIGACLQATGVADDASLAADAIDQLERLIGCTYRPGAGVGRVADQVATASTLLTAYSLSGRLPYSMLAEELMQCARPIAADDFLTSCEAARVLCRLALLHDDAEYRAAAVIAPDADYRRDAIALLAAQAAEADRRGGAGAIYGVALLELESAQDLKSEI